MAQMTIQTTTTPHLAAAGVVLLGAVALASAASKDCGTHLSPDDVVAALQRSVAGDYAPAAGMAEQRFFVPLAIHVVRRSDGTGGITPADVTATIDAANVAFDAAGIEFCQFGPVLYIDSTSFYLDITSMFEIDQLRTTDVVDGAVNVYFTESLAFSGIDLCGISSFTSSAVQGIAMANVCTAAGSNASTFAHELGHYFDLYHTHETSFGVECPDGSNCSFAGDMICDTSADPQLGPSNVSGVCEYVGPVGPPCGSQAYNPPTRNHMSYAPNACRSIFTELQLDRIRATLVNLRPELAFSDCPTLEPTPGLALASSAASGGSGNGLSEEVTVSRDGRYAAFRSEATDLLDGGPVVPPGQIYVRDLQAGVTTLVSVSSSGALADDGCFEPSLSADGRYVAFVTGATNLTGDEIPELTRHVYRHDRLTGETIRVNVALDGGVSVGWATAPVVSDDGGIVAFKSSAPDLVAGDTNGFLDVFLADLDRGTIELISVDGAGEQAQGHSFGLDLSADASLVAFTTAGALDQRDTNGWGDVYLRNRVTGETTFIAVGPNDEIASMGTSTPSISADGTRIAFTNWGTGLLPEDQTTSIDVVVWDATTGAFTLASVNDAGEQANQGATFQSLSGDGRHVAFQSSAWNMSEFADGQHTEIFVHDLVTRTTRLLSPGIGGVGSNSWSFEPEISGDGRVIVYESTASNLVPGDDNGVSDVFVFELSPAAPWDLDGDGTVGFADLVTLLAAWGGCGACPADLDGDGAVGLTDLTALLAHWGPVD